VTNMYLYFEEYYKKIICPKLNYYTTKEHNKNKNYK